MKFFSFVKRGASAFCYICNFVMFSLMGVKFQGLKINGRLFFRCYGDFIYGEGVVINSSYGSNPIGGNTFCSIVVCHGATLSVGANVGVSNTSIYCAHQIDIDDNVLIGGDCKIYDTDFHSVVALERLRKGDKGKSKSVHIKSGAFIGTGSIILKGSVVGCNSVVGAGAVVSGVIPDNQVWAGNPARFIRNVS